MAQHHLARTRTTGFAALALGSALVLAGCGDDGSDERSLSGDASADPSAAAEAPDVSVELADAEGAPAGTVELTETDGGVQVHVEAEGLTPGFHGFHVHTTGLCEPESAAPDDPATTGAFLSAGGHWNPEEGTHGSHGDDPAAHVGHGGDLPSLQATEDGTATLTVVTDRFTLDDLADEDGSAFMVHAGADNFANVPERYAPEGPDETTQKTGDSGDRVACGVVDAG